LVQLLASVYTARSSWDVFPLLSKGMGDCDLVTRIEKVEEKKK
jgi:hypothetical protein